MSSKIGWFFAGAAALAWSAVPLAGEARAAETVEHTVRSGDNLHLLAGYYYKDPRQWKRIWKVNRTSVKQPGVLEVGSVLRVEVEPGSAWDIPYEEFLAKVNASR